MTGVGRAYEGDAAVEEGGLLTVLRRVPAYRRYWRVELSEEGEPKDPETLARVARENALIRIEGLATTRQEDERDRKAPGRRSGIVV